MSITGGATLGRLLEKMVPDPEHCREAAWRLRERYPSESPEQLARRAVQAARKQGAAVGAATGTASNPLFMVPAALADMAAMLRIEGVLAGTIAALLDPVAVDLETLRTDLVGILFPGAVSQVLRQVGVRAGEQATKTIIRKSLSEDMLKVVVRMATRHVGTEVTRNALVEKAVPLVGAGIGAGWNWFEAGAVGERAIRYYKGEPLKMPALDTVKEAVQGAVVSAARRVRSVVQRAAPGQLGGPPAASPPALPAPGEGTV